MMGKKGMLWQSTSQCRGREDLGYGIAKKLEDYEVNLRMTLAMTTTRLVSK